jgi:RNA polymerase sigma-70 factor (ECF subfamily)
MRLRFEQPNDDTDLMDRFARGDRNAFEKLYEKYYPVVWSFLISCHGDPSVLCDLAQEVFTRLWQQRGQYRGLSDVKTYILAIAKNVLAKEEVSIHRETVVQKRMAMELPRTPSLDLFEFEDLKEPLRQAISHLAVKQKEAVEMVHFLELSPVEAAKRADCSLETLRNRLYCARENLRQQLSHLISGKEKKTPAFKKNLSCN